MQLLDVVHDTKEVGMSEDTQMSNGCFFLGSLALVFVISVVSWRIVEWIW